MKLSATCACTTESLLAQYANYEKKKNEIFIRPDDENTFVILEA